MRYFIILSSVLAVAIGANAAIQDHVVDKVLSGEYALECHMKDGLRVIETSKITGEINGKWTFEDGGYAGNCKVIKGGDL